MMTLGINFARRCCDWCGAPATYWVTVDGWTDYACRRHLIQHFPNLWHVQTVDGTWMLTFHGGYGPVNVWVSGRMVEARYRRRVGPLEPGEHECMCVAR